MPDRNETPTQPDTPAPSPDIPQLRGDNTPAQCQREYRAAADRRQL